MATYSYTGRDSFGKPVKGKTQARDESTAILSLKEKRISVTTIEEMQQGLYQDIEILKPIIKSKDFVLFLRQFSTLLKAGVPVIETIDVLSKQTTSKPLKKALVMIEEDVRSGKSLSAASAKQGDLFPPLFTNMVKAGEAGGRLDDILDRLATYYEKQHRLKQKVMATLTYPMFVGVVAIAIIIFLLVFVVPTFASMFASFGGELPTITKLVMAAGDLALGYWWTVPIIGLVIFLGWKMGRRHAETRLWMDNILLRIPVFGTLIQKSELARVTQTLGALFQSSVPVLQALTIVERVADNRVIANVIRKSRASLQQGETLAGPMESHWAFPPLVTQMISVGEKSGSLDTMLEKAADFYEAEVEATTDQIKALIEPVMIILLAGIVGTIVLAIMVPMFEIFTTIG
ncbi:type II secretion system F family protein [Alkalicoccobacillus porphyridii]|uniref:Type II secretion system F family protein n=1 Tax=Alkalicoccobacillus porphyridii TaxID=2597270 RepID=A0A553ZXQ5_9BACI|nr:type II secretion system F family protein [Alkalicoccobacillus porphyridii]TSB46241.1 type II secretion system F family protein [Alkalicoccobacillus porphyridii]